MDTAYGILLLSDGSSYTVETDVGPTNNHESRRMLRCWCHISVDKSPGRMQSQSTAKSRTPASQAHLPSEALNLLVVPCNISLVVYTCGHCKWHRWSSHHFRMSEEPEERAFLRSEDPVELEGVKVGSDCAVQLRPAWQVVSPATRALARRRTQPCCVSEQRAAHHHADAEREGVDVRGYLALQE
jgi:hypothetical protein